MRVNGLSKAETSQALRPIRDLLLQLPHLTVNEKFEIDYAVTDPALLVQLANNGDAALRTIHRGISAIGLLMANSSPEIESCEIPGDATEAIGWLIGELGEFAAVIHYISASCRKFTPMAGNLTKTPKCFPNTKP